MIVAADFFSPQIFCLHSSSFIFLKTYILHSLHTNISPLKGSPGGSVSKESACDVRDLGSFLPGASHGQIILAGYSPWGHKESDMTEVTFKSSPWLPMSHKVEIEATIMTHKTP